MAPPKTLLAFALFAYATCACRFSEKLDLRPRDAASGVLESFRSLLDASRGKPIVTVTCPELGNATFSSAPPFDVLGVPQCGVGNERVRLTLYLPPDGEQQCQVQPFFLPNDVTTQCVEALRRRRSNVNKLVILIHGFLKDFEADWLHQMQAALQRADNSLAVIIVGWGHGRRDIIDFWRAAANMRYVAESVFLTLRAIHATVPLDALPVHCVGHSLGAHACGFIGKRLKEGASLGLAGAVKLDRISAMDPAGPLFCNDVPFPFHDLDVKPEARLGPGDADLVDVIHTDGDARYLGVIPQYGTMEPLGHLDFYPGTNGDYGHDQPGCREIINIVSCSHSRAHELYSASIASAICLSSRECTGDDPHAIPDGCHDLPDPTNTPIMGYWLNAEVNTTVRRKFTVEVSGQSPFCV